METTLAGEPYPVNAELLTCTSKIGGRPVGVLESLWPRCRQCGRHMDFLLQLDLRSPLAISRHYASACLFMCNGYQDRPNGRQCETWYPDAGANRVLLLEACDERLVPPHLGIRRWPEFGLRFTRKKTAAELREQQERSGKAFLAMLKTALESGAHEARWHPPDRPHQTV